MDYWIRCIGCLELASSASDNFCSVEFITESNFGEGADRFDDSTWTLWPSPYFDECRGRLAPLATPRVFASTKGPA
jgi:hypothetical protein